jgi:Domain of unknown function (DUF4406)
MSIECVYIAGPFRGKDHYVIFQNICRAEALSLEVWRLGHACFCPHLNTAHFQDAAPDRVWMEGDLEILRRCDAVLMVPGWRKSKGARAERKLAKSMGMPVFEKIAELKRWLKT